MSSGRKVKCKHCKSELNSLTAFKTVIGNKNEYYCDEIEYTTITQEKQDRKDLIEFVCKDIFEYSEKQMVSTYLLKQIKEMHEGGYSYKIIKRCFEDNCEKIKYYLSHKQNLDTEQRKLQYIIAIIKNTINDTTIEINIKKDVNIDKIISDDELIILNNASEMKKKSKFRTEKNILKYLE